MTNKKFNKSTVFTLSSAHMMHDIYSSFLAPLLPLLIEKFSMSLTVSALLEIARKIPALLNPVLGLLAEKVGIRYFAIFTPAITAISMSLLGIAPSYLVLFILLFVAGISSALFHIPSPVMIKQASAKQIGKGMSWFMVGGESARTLGPLLLTSAVSLWGLEGTYRLMPLGLLASAILFFKLKDIKIDQLPQKRKEKGDTKKALSSHVSFLKITASYLIFQSGIKSALTLYLPLYLIQQGESLWYAGISLALLQFFGVLGAFFAGGISDKLGRVKTLFIANTGSIISTFLFIYSGQIYFLALLGLFLFATGPVLLASVQDRHCVMPTLLNSLYMSVVFGVSSLTVLAVGSLGDHFGLANTYVICNVFALGTIPMTILLHREAKKSEV